MIPVSHKHFLLIIERKSDLQQRQRYETARFFGRPPEVKTRPRHKTFYWQDDEGSYGGIGISLFSLEHKAEFQGDGEMRRRRRGVVCGGCHNTSA